MTEKLCYTCKYFDNRYGNPNEKNDVGECRRRSPVSELRIVLSSERASALFPEMRGYGWCGEWEQGVKAKEGAGND